jgi:integrase
VSIQRRIRGGRRRYEVRWREGGRQRSRTFDRRADAEAFDAERRRRAQLGAHAPAEPSPEPLREWLETWWRREAHGWARSTRMVRAAVMDKWLIPYLGDVPLRDLGEDRVMEWRGQVSADGCPAMQANHALSILSAALSAARRARKVPANPCQGIRRLRVEVSRPRALTPEQVEAIRAAMARPQDAVLVSVMAYAGLRPEEALPLRWSDLGRTIVVSRTWTHGELRERTKTGRIRAVEIVAPLAADLESIRPKAGSPDEWVFPSPTGLLLDLHNWRERMFKPAARTAGVEATPYDLRHTYVSLLIHEGRSVPYVAAMAGHSPRMCLERYAHAFAEAQLGAGQPMGEAIAAARAALDVRPVCDVRVLRASAGPPRSPC